MSGANFRPIRVGSLDSLRGIAILLVIMAHTVSHYDSSAMFKTAGDFFGNLGVQLFFIVSAYTMCMMWHGREAEHRRLEKFYIRRFCRIAVPYWFAIILYQSLKNFDPNSFTFWGIFSNLTFLHGFFPAYINSVVPGGWSIADEMNFYFIFPLIITLTPLQITALAISWYSIFGVGLTIYLGKLKIDDLFIYYSLITQLPVFLIGVTSYEMGRGKDYNIASLLKILCLYTAWIAVAFALRHQGLAGRPFFWLEIMLMSFLVWLAVRLGANLRILSFIGRRSYSMYLLHFCALVFLSKFLPAHAPWIAGFAATVALSVIAATAGQKTIEAWGQALGKWLIARLPAEIPRSIAGEVQI